MAPEQKAGRDVDRRADIYAMGLVLFEMLVGNPRVNVEMLDADLPHVPADLRTVIRAACQLEPDARFESTEAFVSALARFASPFRTREKPGPALCVSPKCPDAQWTSRGYYEGPRFIKETTDNCCKACGANLMYPCERCGRPFEPGSRFCGTCGTSFFEVPQCKQCLSWLTLQDMDADTMVNGCEKCRRKQPRPTRTVRTDGDDIPF